MGQTTVVAFSARALSGIGGMPVSWNQLDSLKDGAVDRIDCVRAPRHSHAGTVAGLRVDEANVGRSHEASIAHPPRDFCFLTLTRMAPSPQK
jgi:hypothetical protein